MPNRLEAILTYEMDEIEAKAYKAALVWEKLVPKEFPDLPYTRLKKKGDPRKSILFRYCYKLIRETQGILPDDEIAIYILSQLHVLKGIAAKTRHPMVEPQVLVGDKAWKRWKLWKSRYDKRIKEHQTAEEIKSRATKLGVIADLDNTKKFLFDRFNGQPTYNSIKAAIDDRTLVRWVTLSKVSPYYAILSPLISKALSGETLEEVFLFDLSIYKDSITPEVEEYFKLVFSGEF